MEHEILGAPTSEQRRRSLRERAVGLLIQVALFIFVFGWLLPQFIDYEETWNAIKSLAWWEFAILFGFAVARLPTEALIYRALLPGLHLRVGSEAYLSQNFAGLLPPPVSSIVQYAYFRSDGFERQPALIGAVGSFIFPTAGRIVMPLVAVILLIATGNFRPEALIVAAISIIILLIAVALIWLVGRSDASARWVGNQSGRAISWVLIRFRRDPIEGLGELLVNFRTHTYGIVRERWFVGTIAISVNLLFTFLLLLLSVRFVGLSSEETPWSGVFAALAVGFFAGCVLPLSSSGMGTSDVVIIAALSAMSGDASLAAAGEFIWRVFYSVLALPIGVFTLGRFRKRHGELITDAWQALSEMRGDVDSPAPADHRQPARELT
jgi:uncharacterized membrane protein YbhN (UPF0104 family)